MSGGIGSAAVIVCALACSLGGATTASAQSPADYSWAIPDWRQTWSEGPLGDDRGFVIKSTTDAVYVAGVSGSGKGGGDVLLQKYSKGGTLEWSRIWGGHELDQAQAMVLAPDGIYVAGAEGSMGDSVNQSVVLKFGYDGTLAWAKVWNAGTTSQLQSIAASGDSVFVAGLSHRDGNRDAYVARLSKNDGSRIWQKRWGTDAWDEAFALEESSGRLYVVGYTTDETAKTDNLLLVLDSATGAIQRATVWGGPGNDEARAIALEPGAIWVAGGGQVGTSGDAFLSKLDPTGTEEWTKYAGRRMTGAYGIAIGERGIYLAGGSYDFPAGGDMAISRWSRTGEVEWSQIYGLPGFWDWAFDVETSGGKFYVTGTLWVPGEGWYEILTIAYDENFDTVKLPDAVAAASAGDTTALEHFQIGDLLKWARQPAGQPEGERKEQAESGNAWQDEDPAGTTPPPPSDGAARIYWVGASDFGRERGQVWVDTERDGVVGEENAQDTFAGLQRDFPGNPALVRNYTGIRGSALNGLIRFRYFISHDRLIPQGGFISVGDTTVPLPPPPV